MSECNIDADMKDDPYIVRKEKNKDMTMIKETDRYYNCCKTSETGCRRERDDLCSAFRHYIPFLKGSRGSVTVEASVCLPIVVCMAFSVMLLFQILSLKADIRAALDETTREMAIAGYVEELAFASDGNIAEKLLAEFIRYGTEAAYASQRTIEGVGREKLDNSLIQGGSDGLGFYLGIMQRELGYIDLKVTYYYRIPFIMKNIKLTDRSVRRVWNGRSRLDAEESDAEGNSEEEVYITENGKVYHVFIDCQSLKRTVEAVSCSEAGDRRNKGGGKYKPCEECVRGSCGAIVYITPEGNRYHASVKCGSLMRYIRRALKSEAAGMEECKFCRAKAEKINMEKSI